MFNTFPFWGEYHDVPQLKHEQTFEEYLNEHTDSALYSSTAVDDATKTALRDFFLFDRLCDTPDRFAWLYRRSLARFYPIYKDSFDVWEGQKLKGWFFDNSKYKRTEHTGEGTLDEKTKADLTRELTRAIVDVLSGTSSNEGTTKSDTTTKNDSSSEGADAYTDNGTNKGRNFSFNYPESNYQGGVIPYDIDNNPSVEFINAQADSLGKDTTDHSGTNSNESHTTGSTNAAGSFQNSGTTSNNNKSDTTENSHDVSTGSRDQDTTTHWIEMHTRQGDNIVSLAREILSELPGTDFFNQFTEKMARCFQHVYLSDEIDEQEGYYND